MRMIVTFTFGELDTYDRAQWLAMRKRAIEALRTVDAIETVHVSEELSIQYHGTKTFHLGYERRKGESA